MNFQTIHQPNFLALSPTRINNHSIQYTGRQQAQNVSPVIYKNSQILQNRVLIPTSIRSISPQQNQAILRQSYQVISSPFQSQVISKSTSSSPTLPNRQYIKEIERTPNSYHQSSQKIQSSNQNNSNQKQINTFYESSPNSSKMNTFIQQNTQFQQEQDSKLKMQQSHTAFTQSEQLSKLDFKVYNSNKKDFSSLQKSQNYRLTQMTESDQDILNIVSKYIGNKPNFNYQSQRTNNNTQYYSQTYYDNIEISNSQYQLDVHQKSQQSYNSHPNQIDFSSKGNHSYVEEAQHTQQSQTGKQQVEIYHTQQTNQNNEFNLVCSKDLSSNLSANNSIESQRGINYEQMVLMNTEYNKQQQLVIQESINQIKKEKFSQNKDSQYLESTKQTEEFNQQNEIPEKSEKQQDKIKEYQTSKLNQQENQPVPPQNLYQKPIPKKFTECSNIDQDNQNSPIEENIESDDRLNLAVFEDDNQILDIISSDKLEDNNNNQQNQHQQQDNNFNNIPEIQDKGLKRSFKSNSNHIQVLDPIQEEDFLSRSSFDNGTIKKQLSGSFIASQNQTQGQYESSNNLMTEKIDIQNKDVPFVIEQELKQQVNQIYNQNLIKQIDLQEQKNPNHDVLEEDMQLFDSNLDDIGCIPQRSCEENLFSQDSYENYLEIYSSDQNNIQRESYKSQKNFIKQDHQRSSSDVATNQSQNFQSISSFENESLRRSTNNLASFGPSPRISVQNTYQIIKSQNFFLYYRQTNEQTYLNGNSATFNSENGQQTEQSPEVQSKQKLSQLIAESEKDQYLDTPQIQKEEIKKTEPSKKILNFKDTIKLIVLFLITILIGFIFIIQIQGRSLIHFSSYNQHINEKTYSGQTSNQQVSSDPIINYYDYYCEPKNVFEFLFQTS